MADDHACDMARVAGRMEGALESIRDRLRAHLPNVESSATKTEVAETIAYIDGVLLACSTPTSPERI